MNRFPIISLLLAGTIAATVACKGMPAEFAAPDFTLKSPMTGKETTYSALKGRPVIIYWFTSW